jgi:gliding motility-associated-like protein
MIKPAKRFYLILCCCFFCFAHKSTAQVNIDFEIPDTVCINDSMQVINRSGNASSYYWNFCSGNLAYIPEGENMTNVGQVNGPAFIDVVKTTEGFYSFVTNHVDATLTRNFFGNSLSNNPVSENLGNAGGISHIEGIQVVQDNGNWYGFITGGVGNESSLIRLDFGNSLFNKPTVTNLGNIGGLSYPMDLFLYKESGTWIGLTINYTTSTLTRFVFNNGLNNIPSGENLGNPAGLEKPCGLHAMLENNTWLVFVTNFDSHTISRISFGNSLMNTPEGVNLGGSGTLASPFDITMIHDCEMIFGIAVNHYISEVVRIDFGDNIMASPSFQSIGNIGGMYQPHGLSQVFRENDTLFVLTANINNTLTRIFFPPCNNASLASSTQRNPPKVTYNKPGIYNVSLTLDEGLPTEQVLCKNVVVFENPDISLGNDTSLLPGTTVTLNPGSNFRAYEWSDGETTPAITVGQPGTYSVVVTDTNGCKAFDQVIISVKLYIPEFFTPNGDGINDTWEIEYFRTNPDATIEIFDRFGNRMAKYRGDQIGWDGKYNGTPVKADSYWYVITFDDGSAPLRGYVSVIR